MYSVMTIAFELGRPLEEVLGYPIQHIRYWLAFFKVRQEKIKAAETKNKPRVRK